MGTMEPPESLLRWLSSSFVADPLKIGFDVHSASLADKQDSALLEETAGSVVEEVEQKVHASWPGAVSTAPSSSSSMDSRMAS